MTDPRTNAELADFIDALNAGTIARDPDILRAASARLRAMDEALAPFAEATGVHDDGSVWVERDRVPHNAWIAARTARGES